MLFVVVVKVLSFLEATVSFRRLNLYLEWIDSHTLTTVSITLPKGTQRNVNTVLKQLHQENTSLLSEVYL